MERTITDSPNAFRPGPLSVTLASIDFSKYANVCIKGGLTPYPISVTFGADGLKSLQRELNGIYGSPKETPVASGVLLRTAKQAFFFDLEIRAERPDGVTLRQINPSVGWGGSIRLGEAQAVQLRDELNLRYPKAVANAPAPVVQAAPAPAKRAAPKGDQQYRGNGSHKWEVVTEDTKGAGATYRLRVPGGFLYRTVSYKRPGSDVVSAQSTTFVPMPDAVGYAV
jgi:hypothetical protein